MAPSRGSHPTSHHAPTTHSSDEAILHQQSKSALSGVKRNLNYLYNPTSSDRPTRMRTRALLRSVRYLGQFLFWRLVRWAKYAAVGFAVATVSATAIGSVFSGAAFVLAPTGIAGSIVAASVWGVGKYIARKAHKRWERMGGDRGVEAKEQAEDGPWNERTLDAGAEIGASAVPW